MKIPARVITVCVFLFLSAYSSYAQLYKVELDEKVNKSSLIIEGKVIAKKSFWNDEHTMIFTSNTVELYKIFKGDVVEKTVEIMTQGGGVGTDYVEVSDLLTLEKGNVGIFFCEPNSSNVKSPINKKLLYDVYSSGQGFLRYDLKNNKAFAPFVTYSDIVGNLYKIISQKTQQNFKTVASPLGQSIVSAGSTDYGTGGVLATISSFSPTTVHGGALNDPTNNILTITGTGFGTKASGSCAVNFKDGNSNNAAPDYAVPYTSGYLVSWSDNKIVVRVPARAATGVIAVVLKDGTEVQSSTSLDVFYSVLNFSFNFDAATAGVDTVVVSEPRLMNANSQGGYSIQYSTSTAGGGKDFSTSPAKETFLRALTTWKENVGVNFIVGAATSTQKIADDKINLIVFDNKNTGVPVMGAGVLEVTYSWGSTCYNDQPFQVFTSQKTGFDILVRNDGVSVGSNPFATGPCFPGNNDYDLETVLLHELGHCLDLTHINDDAEGNFIPDLNPEKVMHYAITNFVDRRSLDNSAYVGAQYSVKKQGDTYGSCLFQTEMNLLSFVTVTNDECPVTFPSTATADGTIVNFDLVHATSNKFKDPQFDDITCNATGGSSITNNAYYAFRTSATTNGTLSMSVSGYTTTPAELAACDGQGIAMAVYDVSTCPAGQQFPAAIACRTFSGNDSISDITGLKQDHTYLFYFEGLRNTKAVFNINFNGDGTAPPAEPTITVYPNPVKSYLNINMQSIPTGKYNFLVYDIAGRLCVSQEQQITFSQIVQLPFYTLASGVYIVNIIGPDGKVILRKKIMKYF